MASPPKPHNLPLAGRPSPAHPGFTARRQAVTRAPSRPQAPPRPRFCLPEPGGGGAAPAGPPDPGEPQGGTGGVQGPQNPSPSPGQRAQRCARPSPHPPPSPPSSQLLGLPPRIPGAHLTADSSRSCFAALRPPAAHAPPLPAAQRVSGRGRVLRGAGWPGAPPPQVRPAPPTARGKLRPAAPALRQPQNFARA